MQKKAEVIIERALLPQEKLTNGRGWIGQYIFPEWVAIDGDDRMDGSLVRLVSSSFFLFGVLRRTERKQGVL